MKYYPNNSNKHVTYHSVSNMITPVLILLSFIAKYSFLVRIACFVDNRHIG